MTRRQVIGWVALLASVLAGAELLNRVHFPAPQMILAIVVGGALALAGKLPAPMPRQLTCGVQSMLGVLMGSYLEISLLSSIGLALIPVLAVTVATLLISLLVAVVFARFAHVELPTATLGLLAGGSAAVVAVADDMDADPRQVAFMQYLRVALVAVSAPALGALLNHSGDGMSTEHATLGASVTNPDLPFWMIVGRGDQVAGLSIAVMLCVVGTKLGKRLSLPSPALIGPMLMTAALTAFGVSHGYAPTNLFKDLLFVLIGFEVGTRFTRTVVREMARMIPGMTVTIVALSAIVAGLAFAVATFVDLELSDIYLATTPGGINAVLATAESMDANLPLITCVQSMRLLLMVLMLPLLAKGMRWFSARQLSMREPELVV
ncbi:AbrB family transcriptional regulator [Nocardia sp. NPDC060256]|uniref:AbrB family transcriptional regulator n=1 Tax=unclassified Nocardia TaxID=2637762 RepID=UPI00365C696B